MFSFQPSGRTDTMSLGWKVIAAQLFALIINISASLFTIKSPPLFFFIHITARNHYPAIAFHSGDMGFYWEITSYLGNSFEYRLYTALYHWKLSFPLLTFVLCSVSLSKFYVCLHVLLPPAFVMLIEILASLCSVTMCHKNSDFF